MRKSEIQVVKYLERRNTSAQNTDVLERIAIREVELEVLQGRQLWKSDPNLTDIIKPQAIPHVDLEMPVFLLTQSIQQSSCLLANCRGVVLCCIAAKFRNQKFDDKLLTTSTDLHSSSPFRVWNPV